MVGAQPACKLHRRSAFICARQQSLSIHVGKIDVGPPCPARNQVTSLGSFSSSNTEMAGGVPLSPSSVHLATTAS